MKPPPAESTFKDGIQGKLISEMSCPFRHTIEHWFRLPRSIASKPSSLFASVGSSRDSFRVMFEWVGRPKALAQWAFRGRNCN